MEPTDFISEFARRLRAGDAAVVCGAGISVPSSLPNWNELLADARAELDLDDSFSDLALLATYYVSQIDGGRARLTKAIRSALTAQEFDPNPIHHLLWDLPVSYLWSLNFDNLLELAHQRDKGHLPRIIQDDSEMTGSLSRGGCTLVKMHGGIDDIEATPGRRLVITRDDFDAYVKTFPRTWARLIADFYTKSILFIGISFADPNMQTLLRLVRTSESRNMQRHFTIVEKAGDDLDRSTAALYALQTADLRQGGVEAVEVDSFNDIPDLLRRLEVASRPPAVMLCGSLAAAGPAVNHFMNALGTKLATVHDQVSLVHGGSETIGVVAHRFAEHLERSGRYGDSRLVQVRRSEPGIGTETVTERRLGTIVFPGTRSADVRVDLCSRASICVVIGGGEHTRLEVEECRNQGVRVIPVPVGENGGGAAPYSHELWNEMSETTDGQWLRSLSMNDPIVLAELVAQEVSAHLRGHH
ncbi:SIR2 family protein [Nocardioides sp. BYT-33-1]|uniref:SIR2 family protein n=1 Tax=Nocardioides sp. BYT-33-1 TaxID=3416952 RepID=UPI003F53CF10